METSLHKIDIPETPSGEKSPNPTKKRMIFLGKILFTVVALYIVVTKADLDKITQYVLNADLLYMFMALLVLNVGQLISGLRMRYYFESENLTMSRSFAIALYYVGMLFNLVLPGGIGGDGYKAYYAKQHLKFPLPQTIRLLISNRANGMLMLTLLTLTIAFFSDYLMSLESAKIFLIICFVVTVPCYSILAKNLLKEPIKTQIGAVWYSTVVQGSVVITTILLLLGTGYEGNMIDYIVLFMVSSIVSILPISLGGIGLRELTFFYGANLFLLDPELGVTISVLYFVVNTLASLLGVIFFYQIGKMEHA